MGYFVMFMCGLFIGGALMIVVYEWVSEEDDET